MSYFEDLSDYRFSGRLLLEPRAKNVGWLGSGHPFEVAVPDDDLLEIVWRYCSISVVQTRGLHHCEFCPDRASNSVKSKGRTLLLGSAEIRVFSLNGNVYAAPNLIYHYISVHHYKPPEGFIQALREMPRPPNPEYLARLANLGLDWQETSAPDTRPEAFRFEKLPDGTIVRKTVT